MHAARSVSNPEYSEVRCLRRGGARARDGETALEVGRSSLKHSSRNVRAGVSRSAEKRVGKQRTFEIRESENVEDAVGEVQLAQPRSESQ